MTGSSYADGDSSNTTGLEVPSLSVSNFLVTDRDQLEGVPQVLTWFYDYWHNASVQEGGVPHRHRLKPEGLAKVLSRIILWDVEYGSLPQAPDRRVPRFKYRLIGEKNRERIKSITPGKFVDQIYPGDYLNDLVQSYQTALDAALPQYQRSLEPMKDGLPLAFHRLMVPFTTGGTVVDMMAAVFLFDDDVLAK